MTKPRRGRPPLAGKTATGLVKVRLTETDRKRWLSAAEREGLSLSEWLRAAAELAVARGATR